MASKLTEDHIEAFLVGVQSIEYIWASVEVLIVAASIQGVWHNLSTRLVLSTAAVDDVETVTDAPVLPQLLVVRHVYSAAYLRDLIAQIQAGTLQVGNEKVHYLGGHHPNRLRAPYDDSSIQIGRSLASDVQGEYHYGHALHLRGGSVREVLELIPGGADGLDAALRGLSDPWESINAVARYFLRDPRGLTTDMSCRVAAVAVLPVRIHASGCWIQGPNLHYDVRVATPIINKDASLVVTGVASNGDRIGRRIPLPRTRWAKIGLEYRTRGRLRLQSPQQLTVTLQLHKFELGQLEPRFRHQESLPLMQAREAFIRSEASLVEQLGDPESAKGRRYEPIVARLFSYCGFACENVGTAPETQDGPDILVAMPELSKICVVEVTVGTLNNKGKLAKLGARTTALKEVMRNCNWGAFPVIVTANHRTAVSINEIQEAEIDGIRVLAQEDMIHMLRMATSNAGTAAIAQFVQTIGKRPRSTPGLGSLLRQYR